jgi:hypothetical protein
MDNKNQQEKMIKELDEFEMVLIVYFMVLFSLFLIVQVII